MWKAVFLFELRYQLRQPLFAVSAVLFFALALGLGSSDIAIAIGDAPGTRLRNAPLVLVRLMPVLSLLGLFVITAFIANAALRDFESRSDSLLFTKPLTRLDYLGGRLTGSLAVSLLILLAALAGLITSQFVPWQPDDRIGPFSMAPHLFGLLVIIIPNLLVMGALFFALAISSRRLSVTYLGVVFFIGMQDLIEVAVGNLQSPMLAGILEPSGVVALESLARYWTVAEQSVRLPELDGILLTNRLLWLSLAVLVLVLSLRRFDFTLREGRRRGIAARSPQAADGEVPASDRSDSLTVPAVTQTFGPGTYWRQLGRQVRIELSEVIPRAPFLTLLAFGLMFTVAYSWVVGSHEGAAAYPQTYLMLEGIQLGVRLTLVMILVFYAGELLFSERALKLSEVYDALPVPNGVFLSAKLMALCAIAVIFIAAAGLSTISLQLGKGSVQPDAALYARGLIFIALPLLPLIALALFLQVLANQKLWGLLLVVLVLLLGFALPKLGWEDHLYLYGGHPPINHSGLNGYAQHAEGFLWFMAYWSLGALVLVLGALWLWPRGRETSLKARLANARQRLSRPTVGVAAAAVLGMLMTGLWIFQNTHVRAEYRDRGQMIQRLADYELAYRQYRELPLPRTTSVFAEVDIFPERRQVDIRGRYRLENPAAEPIHLLPITVSPRWVEGVLPVYGGVSLTHLDLPEHRLLVEDASLGFYVIELAQALEQGQAIDLEFTVRVDHRAFRNSRQNFLVVDNGTFFSRRSFFPVIGYSDDNQLQDPVERKKRGLPPPERVPALEDPRARERNYLDSDWIHFESIVSTGADQIAIAPGHLQRQWLQDGRRYFHYRTRAPIINLLPFLSGRYAVRRDTWEGVEIEIYFDPDHAFNIDRFLEIARRSLAYMSRNFGPYPHGHLRIVQVPNYHGKVAFAFPQTIAFSESWGFNLNLDQAAYDSLAALLAHEVAHQWWNHQLVPAHAQGATWIAESLSQYSAAMILEEWYGSSMVRQFLANNLDYYLRGRGKERLREMPLLRVENQGYVHYGKGAMAWYALQERIGEAALNRALKAFLAGFAFQGPPYATAADLLSQLYRVTPAAQTGLLEDLFETITLFENRVADATFSERDDGRYLVEVEIASRKLRDDGDGVTSELPLDDWIDIGVFGEREVDGETREVVLVRETRHLRSNNSKFSFVVDERPRRAAVDPYHTLVDRNPDNNTKTLTELSRP